MANEVTNTPVKIAMLSSVPSVPADLLKAYSDWLGKVGSEEKSATKLRDIALGFGIVSDYCKSPKKESTDQQHIAAFGLAKDLITAKAFLKLLRPR
jgi:hypothetical protein